MSSGYNGCVWGGSTPHGGNNGVDTLMSVYVHELEEAASDPEFDGWWFSTDGYENADRCAWITGPLLQNVPNNAKANVMLGGQFFLLQQNWVRNPPNSACATSF